MNKISISSGKMFSHIDRVFGKRKPITADIFLNNFCNNNCPYCTYKRWEHEPGARSMSIELFKKVVERVIELGVQGIILTGGGEPTVSHDFDLITEYLESSLPKHIKWGINTNFNVVKFIKPAYLKVSLDAWDVDSYYSNRGVGAYNRVRSNIQEYAAFKKNNNLTTQIGIQMLATSAIDVEHFYHANKNLPVDYISIRPMESTNGSYYKTVSQYTDEQPGTIISTIKKIATLDPRVVLNFKWNLLGQQESTCTAQWSQLAIDERGDVMYCCHKPYQIVGNIFDPDILEKKARVGTDMSMCDIPCRLTAPNLEVSQLLAERKDVEFI